MQKYLDTKRRIVNKELTRALPKASGPSRRLKQAMRYSVLTGGKRVRSVLMLAVADMLKKRSSAVIPAACAVEYMHTSTLILDDLPCMDDAKYRRGRITAHRKFDEDTAILASYSLMTEGFRLITESARRAGGRKALAEKLTASISRALGSDGVCAGQAVDLSVGSSRISRATAAYIHKNKTAILFESCCEMAGLLCGAAPKQMRALKRYGNNLGLAFQISDDMLSVTGNRKKTGKDSKDLDSPNYVKLFGTESARKDLRAYIRRAKSSLDVFGKRAGALRYILTKIEQRDR